MFISEATRGLPIQLEALKMAHDELKKVNEQRSLSAKIRLFILCPALLSPSSHESSGSNCKQTNDTNLYKEVVDRIEERAGQRYGYDRSVLSILGYDSAATQLVMGG